MASRFKPIVNPFDPYAPVVGGTAVPRADETDPAIDPALDPNAPPPTGDPTHPITTPQPGEPTTGQGITENSGWSIDENGNRTYTDPNAPRPTNPNLVQPGPGAGIFEGPQNAWGMDKSAPPLEGFPQWDTATSLKYRFGREVAKYAPTAENAQKVIQDAMANGWDIRPDDRDPTMFWFNNPEMGGWEAVRLLSGNNTWEFNWGTNATGGNPNGAAAATPAPAPDLGPFQPAQTPAAPTTGGADPPWLPQAPSPAPGATTPTSSTDPTVQQAMRDALLKILQQPEISAEGLQNDPAVRAQRIQAQRAEERQRGQLMEQNAFEGLADSGAEQTDLAGIRQQRSESEASFIGQLAIQQMQARREEIMQGIQIATQQGQFDLGQSLARELAALDAALRREQIQASLGDSAASRALQERLANNQLTQQDRQFLLSLGFSYDSLEVTGNANAARWASGE